MLFKIPKTGEIDSIEQSMTNLILKTAYNLVAIINICYIFLVIFYVLGMFLNSTIYKIMHLFETLNTPSYIFQILVFILGFASVLYATNKMFDEKYIPTRNHILLFLISFIINTLLIVIFLVSK